MICRYIRKIVEETGKVKKSRKKIKKNSSIYFCERKWKKVR